MPLQKLLRISVPEDDIRSIAEHVAQRQGLELESFSILEADNWLSIPITVNQQWFAKIVAPQHLHVHGFFTRMRNVAVTAADQSEDLFRDPMFTPHIDVLDMAEHDRYGLEQIQRLNIPTPKPLDVFQHDQYGVLVLEYLNDFTPLDQLPQESVVEYAPELFRTLKQMHDAGVAHGDLHVENILLAPTENGDSRLHMIDATRTNPRSHNDARSYDLACALASLAPLIGANATIDAARLIYSETEIQRSKPFLNFVRIRPGNFDAPAVKRVLKKDILR